MTQDSRALIRDAFEKAKASGRPDWHRMSVAVLKNRILDLTQGLFKESDHGATTFQDFVRQHGDILELDRNTKPPVAILKGVSPEPESTPQRTAVRIRADLWRAALDFSSHRRYVWDGEEHVARPDDGEMSGPALPTITADQFNRWKTSFADGVDDDLRDAHLVIWTERPLPSSYLPSHLKHRWNAFLKAEVYKHLLVWFEAQNLSPPPDLLAAPDSGVTSSWSETLRKELIACLRSMTPEELKRVQIPSSVLIRRKLHRDHGS